MKRKRGSGKRKPNKPRAEVAKEGSANSTFLNAENYSDCGDIGNDGFDPRMEAETTHGDTTMRCDRASLYEPSFLEVTNDGDSLAANNMFKSVASFAAKLSRASGSSSAELMDNSLPSMLGEKIQNKEPRIPYRDPQCDDQDLNTALLVIKKIMKMDEASPFNVPVDPIALGIPDYFDVVVRPMDFGTICNNLELGLKYRNSEDVYKDVKLIWVNCYKYNKKGDHILEVMQRVKSNFMKQWNDAGLFRQQHEVDKGRLETNSQHAPECSARHHKDGHMSPRASMISNSIHQGRLGLSQLQQQQYSPWFSHTQSQHIFSQCRCDWKPMDYQSLEPHCSGHLATPCSTMGHSQCMQMCQGGPITGKNYSQRQDEIRAHQDLPHHLSPSCSTQFHPGRRHYNYQSSSSHLQPSTAPTSGNSHTAGHLHLPIHGGSSSSTCNKCEYACTTVPMSWKARPHNHYHMCSCHVHDHQSLLSCNDQYQPHQQSCHHQSKSSEARNTEPDVGEAGEAGHPHTHSPVESTVRYSRHRLGCPIAPETDGSYQQQWCQIGSSKVQSPSMVHSHPYQPQEKSCQCQLDLGRPEPPLAQDRANNGGAESTVGHMTCQPEYSSTPVTDDCSDQEECQIGLSELQSPSLGQSDQPKENDPQCQPSSSSPVPPQPQGANVCNAESTGLEKKTRGRGPTRCLRFLEEGKRISITTNELGEPVGPEASKFISFLGTLARNGNLAPLTYVDWRAVPEEYKENMWEEVQKKFEIDPNSKIWVVKSLGKKWKDWKSKLKTARYITHTTDEERLADRDERVLPDQWAYLVSHWSSEEAEKRSATNKANRAQQKFGHITGTKSFARIREEQRLKRPDGKAPSRAELFILTRTRKDGKPVNKASSAVIGQLHELTNQRQDTSQRSTAPDDIFSQVVGQDKYGRVRCRGLGPPSDFRGAKPTKAEAMKMVSEANDEVREMKERLVAMEQTCAQMAEQMATMMSMMSSMQKNLPDGNVPDVVLNGSGTSEASPEQLVRSTPLRRSSQRGKFKC